MKVFIRHFIRTFVPAIAALLLGGAAMMFAKVDYSSLNLPHLAPPAILFSIIWPILYFFMGLSSYCFDLNTTLNHEGKTKGLMIYYVNLAMNPLWNLIFFVSGNFTFAAIWLGVNYAMAIYNFFFFYRYSKKAGFLQLPYLIWLIFALYLNVAIAFLN